MFCSQAGIPVQAADPAFLAAYRAAFKGDPLLYGPFTYDAANLLIAAMKQAGSTEPAKYLSALAQIKYDGATGHIEFDAKGDRKEAEMTIFTAKSGKIIPVAIIQSGKLIRYDDFIAQRTASAAPSPSPSGK